MVHGLAETENSQASLNHKRQSMKDGKWETVVLSDVGYEHLVAEVSYGGQFLLLLDREQGRGSVCVAFPMQDGKLGTRIPISELIAQLKISADELCR